MATSILMPALSPTMTVGTLARWLKKEGDNVSSGDLLAEIETDKATMELEASDEGILGRILVQEGTGNIAVNTPIAILVEEGEEVPADLPVTGEIKKTSEPSDQSDIKQHDRNGLSVKNLPEKKEGEAKGKRLFASPLARRIAKEKNLSLDHVKGSGPNGRIIKRDVDEAAQKPAHNASQSTAKQSESSALGKVERIKHSTMRKVIARRLTESKTQVPHFYVSTDIELDALLALRSKLNASLAGENIKISVNDLMIKAVALALRKRPGLNVQYTDDEMLHFEDIDISMAVSIPDGLITPIIRKADQKSLRQISREAKDLAGRARSGKLTPEEFQGGTFSISNMGMFGVRDFAAIINPPQAAILAIAAGEKRPVIRDNQVTVATIMTVTLSVDHRAVDGALGAQWLNTLKELVQNPYALVL
ncbi:pyruvate dehydrogenase complex dihydrolipoamide acetyltransferase [Aristophania vespae]|uniref:pyruvate dehydrogenase complex dihydrolipoamide acetyltransferase n=1 Tax=Aristophania vespae TaxID=2697033 RepID=UPI002351543D|nr:pyruvate dehydrogenase complex dihydrolipoamide acetyltransferase [Aristophania vespae]UMM64772.1 Dihydrolipoyllysine-residue acetyltransferase component of pyruvate dehydrogenase complex [Aristophania vespae]